MRPWLGLAATALLLTACAPSKPAPEEAAEPTLESLRASLTPLQRQSVAHEAFLQALILEDQGQAPYALEALLSTIYYDDSDRWLLMRAVQRMRDLRRSQDAVPLAKKALAMPGATASDWELLAGLWLDLAKPDSARMALDRALALDPTSRPSLVSLAMLAEREGRLKDAASQYAQLALLAENADAFAKKAYQIWGRSGNRDSILALAEGLWARNRNLRDGLIASELLARQKDPSWRRILDSLPPFQDPDTLRPAVHRIRCHWLAGDLDSVHARIGTVLRTTTPEVDFSLVGGLQFENDSGEALQTMLHGLKPDSTSWRVYSILGVLHISRNRRDSAVHWLDRSLALDSSQASSWMRRIIAEPASDTPVTQLALSRAFVRHCPKDVQARWLLAQHLEKFAESRLRSKPWENVPADSEPEASALRREALHHLELTAKLDTAPDRSEFERAALLERLGRVRESDSLLHRIIAADSSNHIALNYLAYVLADRNVQLDVSQRLIDRALRLSPGNGAYLDSRGWLRYRQGNFEKALEDVNAAMEAHRSDEVILEHRALILEALGRTQDALRDWTLLLERVPDYKVAQKALRRLQSSPRSPLP